MCSAAANGYAELGADLEVRARTMPGFISFKTYGALGGERASIVVFDTWEHQCAWRDGPEHPAAQRRGRGELYEEYAISVCEVNAPAPRVPALWRVK